MSETVTVETPANHGRRRAIILLLLLVVGGAGFAIWTSLHEEIERSFAAALPQQKAPETAQAKVEPESDRGTPGRPIGDDEPAFWSDVAIYKAGPDRPRPIVVMKRGKQPKERGVHGHYQGLLARELVRQAFMIAARDELGALVRDVPIGDPDVSGKPDATIQIGSRFRMGYKATEEDPGIGRITIVDTTTPERRIIWSHFFDCKMFNSPDFGYLTTDVEAFSRGKFRKVLEDLGVKRIEPAPKASPDAGLPAGVEERLGQMVETEQFAAIRAIHAAIRQGGESPTLLIGLARAYANLGLLSETQWTADHHAFKARSLIYADRSMWLGKKPKSILNGVGYAYVLTGVTHVGNHEFDAADKLSGKAVEPWLPLIRAFGHSDAGALAKLVTERPDDPLPLFFRFILLSRASGHLGQSDKTCRGEIIGSGRALLSKLPDCYRVLEGITTAQGVANLHTATTLSLETFTTQVPKRLKALPNLPKSVADRLADGKLDEVDIRRQLVAAAEDDASDLSWGVLAKQLREIRFVQVCRRIHFLAYPLSTSPSEEAQAAAPLVRDHPNRDYIETFVGNQSASQMRQMLASLDLSDIEHKESHILYRFAALDPQLRDKLSGLAFAHFSFGLAPEQEQRVFAVIEADCYPEAHNLLKINPDSPAGRAALIRTKWEEAAPKAEAWAKDHGGDTVVLAELGFHALKEGKLEEAQRRFEEAMARSPDRWIFDGLVATYRLNQQTDRWVEAVGKFLKSEDQNLDHAQVTGDLAQYLMDQKEFVKARPWAELSAQSWAGWAMLRAANCAEAMKDWKAAEMWIARTSVRYNSNWLGWFQWCKRTGHGDAHAAAALVEAQLEQGRAPSSDSEELQIALLLFQDGKIDEARQVMERRYRAKHDTMDGILLAMIQDRAGDSEERDATIKAVASHPNATAPKSAKLVGAVGEWLAKGDKAALDLEPIEAIIVDIDEARRPAACVLVAIFLDNHNEHALAEVYFKQANSHFCPPFLRAFALDALRAKGIDPGEIPR